MEIARASYDGYSITSVSTVAALGQTNGIDRFEGGSNGNSTPELSLKIQLRDRSTFRWVQGADGLSSGDWGRAGFKVAGMGFQVDDCPRYDLSDAQGYGTASHTTFDTLHMGAAIDADANSIANADASGDGADDDGVMLPSMTQGTTVTIPVDVTQAAANEGYLQGWIDWNGDGDFADAGEQIAADLQSATAGSDTINISVTPPASATTNQTFARFRWSTTSGLDATTEANDGEVEDYTLTVAADQSQFSCIAKVDVWYANDESGSVSAAEFVDALDFIYQVTDQFYHSVADGAQGGIRWNSLTTSHPRSCRPD